MLVDLRVNVRFRILLRVYAIGLFTVSQSHPLCYQHWTCTYLEPPQMNTQDRQQIPLVNDRFSETRIRRFN
jgi:hypothetical protein